MAEWFLIIPWLISLAVVYFFFLDVVGSKLQTSNPTLYNQVKEGQVKIEDQITAEESTKKDLETRLELLEKNKTDQGWQEGTGDYSKYLEDKKKSEENLAKSQEKLELYQQVKDKGLDGIDFSLWSIGKGLAWFLGIGIILHLIVKSIINLTRKE